MTRKEKLEELLNKVLAGEWNADDDWATWDDRIISWVWVRAAYNGSLDASLHLHKALLPDDRARIDVGRRFRAWVITADNKKFDAYSENPARAWLLAILKALIAQEKDNR